MKATFVLVASNKTENMARKIMLEAHRKADLGFEMTRLPHHVSLKQPFHYEIGRKIKIRPLLKIYY